MSLHPLPSYQFYIFDAFLTCHCFLFCIFLLLTEPTISPSPPTHSSQFNRDRFVLSNGHGCALLYSMMHLTGYALTLEDLKSFRQLGSKCPGHPESHLTEGVEVTTGPLGQGVANSVGLAISERHLAAEFNRPGFPVVANKVWAFNGDGCLQEGVSAEAASLAGHLALDNLIWVYDDNKITIDGETALSFTEDVAARFRAYGWHTITVANGDSDFEGIDAAFSEAVAFRGKPVLISVRCVLLKGLFVFRA
jgi:transketolase